ncbi:MAG: nucleotidyl transferase AbiEii/AbiGii toxin family protein [Elusimicrobia bacterium]|nr:nucleotidyl transferase AbiEii/AbiGii toxin family protein [Elusimicrobiota bacterium]
MENPSFYLREYFHLNLLRHLSLRLSGRAYGVKGGICLRFFHRSSRLSEDMDLDILSQVRKETLANAVDLVLSSKPLLASLALQDIVRIEFRRPKQTETTQRWKVELHLSNKSTLQTKVEFSRRSQKIACAAGIPSAELLNQYKMTPFAAQFYDADSMAAQKIKAMASENRNAARDLFDLHHLFFFLSVKPADAARRVSSKEVEQAAEKTARFTYRDFKEQVLNCLTDDLKTLYKNAQAFEKLRDDVEQALVEQI